MTHRSATVYPTPRAFSLTSSADPDELARELEQLAARTGYSHFARLAEAARRPGPGQRSAATVDRTRQRDAALRRLAAFYPGSRRHQCTEILRLLERYQNAAWRTHDSQAATMPDQYRGGVFEEAFCLMRIGLPVPGRRRLADILNEISP
jgi:hypothetical protein